MEQQEEGQGEDQFKVGDVVRLCSDRGALRRMTVEGFVTDGRILCAWFDGSELFRNVFHEKMITRTQA